MALLDDSKENMESNVNTGSEASAPMSDDTLQNELRVYGLAPDSIVDGPGLRYTIFVQGCPHNCKGCHNPESHDPHGGTEYTIDELYNKIKRNGLIHDVTFSGGEPFDQAAACTELATRLKADGYGVWCYTGYVLRDDLDMAKMPSGVEDFLKCIDVLVDGPFVESLKSLDITWRGSSNQRLIDMPASLDAGEIVLWTA